MHRYILENGGSVKIVECQDFGRDGSKNGRRTAILVKRIDAKAGQLRNFKGKVGLEELFVVLALLVIHDVVHHAIDILVSERRHVNSFDVAIDANHGWYAT